MIVPAKTGISLSFHLTLVLSTVCGLYVYRDVWPLLTFSLYPADGDEGAILWVKVALSIFASILEPFCEPYPYVPVDPKASSVAVRIRMS